MGRKNKYSKEVKLQVINDYINGIKSVIQIANELNCDKSSVRKWIRGYRSNGDKFCANRHKFSHACNRGKY